MNDEKSETLSSCKNYFSSIYQNVECEEGEIKANYIPHVFLPYNMIIVNDQGSEIEMFSQSSTHTEKFSVLSFFRSLDLKNYGKLVDLKLKSKDLSTAYILAFEHQELTHPIVPDTSDKSYSLALSLECQLKVFVDDIIKIEKFVKCFDQISPIEILL